MSSVSSSVTNTAVSLVLSHESPTEPRQQCMVCMEMRRESKFPDGKVTEYCYHPSLTCLRCLEYSIASDHTTKMWDNISCPQCYGKLSYEEVKKFADPITFEQYVYLSKILTYLNYIH